MPGAQQLFEGRRERQNRGQEIAVQTYNLERYEREWKRGNTIPQENLRKPLLHLERKLESVRRTSLKPPGKYGNGNNQKHALGFL